MADSTLLCTLGPHGPGWRCEQLADASAEAGWVTAQPAVGGSMGEADGSSEAGSDAPPSATAAMPWTRDRKYGTGGTTSREVFGHERGV